VRWIGWTTRVWGCAWGVRRDGKKEEEAGRRTG
jgi:hypothetical protein